MPQHAAQPQWSAEPAARVPALRRPTSGRADEPDEKLRQAARLAVVGRLAGGIAHDFNNLLLVINGYTDLVAARLDDDDIRADVKEIRRAGERAAALTRQMLAFCRPEQPLPRAVNVSDVVRDVERMLRALLGDEVVVTTALAPALELVSADQGQLEQVVVNLAVNGRDAMPGGGVLLIETANVRCRDHPGRAPRRASPRGHVRLRVRDCGIGMDADTRERIFDPFFTTKPRGEGTGLGLGIVRDIVDQRGGYIDVTSTPGAGSTFDVYLPAMIAPRGPNPDADPPAVPK